MHPTEIRFLDVARRYTAVGVQAAKIYNNEQAKLNLGQILGLKHLGTQEGTRESLSVLEQLRELTQLHKQMYTRHVLAASDEISAAIKEMPSSIQKKYENGFISSLNWQISAQAEFYVNRERWIEAAEKICRLVESRRASCVFSDAGIGFEDDADVETFSAALAVIEEIHRIEVAAANERMQRLAKSLTILGGGNAS